MGFADLHIHTVYSWDGTCTVPAVLKHVADKTDLNVIAITDHYEIKGALQAVELSSAYGIEVIPGIEISTAEGHLLAYDIRQMVPAGLSLSDTLRRVKDLGGFCIAAHPAAKGAPALRPAAIRRALADPLLAETLIGIETFNAGLVLHSSNAIAEALARTVTTAWVGNSDAHMLWMIGQGATEFSGQSSADLRRAIYARTTRVRKLELINSARMIGLWMVRISLRRAGWASVNAGPDYPVRLGRIKPVQHSI
jgi:predicted metal-dependent phosphoesterase TrpH